MLGSVSSTAYFRDNVLAKRPYLTESMCRAVIANAVRIERQADGRVPHWGHVESLGRWLRVVTLADGVTLHNAFPDRGFMP